MHKYKILALVLLMLLPMTSSIAQTSGIYCGDLSAADCDILRQSRATMQNVETMGFSLNIDYEMSGLQDMAGMDTLSFAILLNGELDVPIAEWFRLYNTSPENMVEILPNYTESILNLLRDTNGKASIELVFPPSLSAEMPKMLFDVVLLDGVIYMDTAPLTGLSQPTWIGMDFVAFYEDMLSESMNQMEGMDLSAVMGTNMFRNMTDPAYTARFRSLARADNNEIEGQATAVFENTYNFGGMFADEQYIADYREYLEATMGEQGLEGMGLDVDSYLEMMASLYQDVTIDYSTWVGLDDYYVHQADLAMSMRFNMNDFMALSGTPGIPEFSEDIQMDMNLSFVMRDFNKPVEVTVPPDAQIIDPFTPFGSSL